ncbi:hypothetical protein D3C71_1422640 [compost metagenome]
MFSSNKINNSKPSLPLKLNKSLNSRNACMNWNGNWVKTVITAVSHHPVMGLEKQIIFANPVGKRERPKDTLDKRYASPPILMRSWFILLVLVHLVTLPL